MKPIIINKTTNKTSDQLDGKDLIEGDKIIILWGNGTTTTNCVKIETTTEKHDPIWLLFKPAGTAFYRAIMDIEIKRAFINLSYNGSYIKIFPNECQNILCERVNEGL